jgi:hypothetical protein
MVLKCVYRFATCNCVNAPKGRGGGNEINQIDFNTVTSDRTIIHRTLADSWTQRKGFNKRILSLPGVTHRVTPDLPSPFGFPGTVTPSTQPSQTLKSVVKHMPVTNFDIKTHI